MFAKTVMFFLGGLLLLISLTALAVSLGYNYSFLASMPENPVVYYSVFAVLSLIIIILSRTRTLM